MKKFVGLLILLTFFLTGSAQDYTENWNSLRKRYEYFNSSGDLIGYKQYNSIRGRWEFTSNESAPRTRERSQREFVSPIDTDLLYQALSRKQAQQNKVFDNIQSHVNQCNSIISAARGRTGGFNNEQENTAIEFSNRIDRLNQQNVDLVANYTKIVSWVEQYKRYFLSL